MALKPSPGSERIEKAQGGIEAGAESSRPSQLCHELQVSLETWASMGICSTRQNVVNLCHIPITSYAIPKHTPRTMPLFASRDLYDTLTHPYLVASVTWTSREPGRDLQSASDIYTVMTFRCSPVLFPCDPRHF